jgi:CBS domain-containing protein
MTHFPDIRAEEHDQVLEVTSRRTLRRPGELTTNLTVACPSRGHDTPFELCVECAKFRGLRLDRASGEASLTCRSDEPEGDGARSGEPGGHGSISEIMTRNVFCVGPELGVDAVAALFLQRGISGAPVVDDDGRPIGVISKTDLLRGHQDRTYPAEGAVVSTGDDDGILLEPSRSPEGPGSLTARDIMMPVVFCLPANESIARAAALMAFERVHRLPVIGVTGEIVGVISSLDVLRWFAAEHGYVISR